MAFDSPVSGPPAEVIMTSGKISGRVLPGLDGLRALAIVAVLAYHAGMPGWGGGLLGVDVFFVLSGFLITTLMVREFEETGSVSLRHFWARRARRLLPGLTVLVAMVAGYAWLNASELDLGAVRTDILATLGYVANWHAITAAQGYFATTGAPSPLLHTWSLAIEEQFYLLWPLVGLWALHRGGARSLARVAAVGALVSAGMTASLYGAGVSVDALYYGTQTRAQDLLTGCLLACVVRLRLTAPVPTRTPRWVRWPAVAAVPALAWCLHAIGGQDPVLYQGGFLVVALLTGAILIRAVVDPRWMVTRLLDLPAVRYVGRISYGLYLYHWPIFLEMTAARTGLSVIWLFVARMAATFAVAVVSFHVVESPVRTGRLIQRFRGRAVLAGASAATLALALVATGLPAAAATTPLVALQATPLPAAVVMATTSHPSRLLVVGDSLALTLALGLSVAPSRYGVAFVTGPGAGDGLVLGCDLDPGAEVHNAGQLAAASTGCRGWPEIYKRLVRNFDPDVVGVLLGRWEIEDHYYRGHWTHIGQADWDTHLAGELDRAVRLLSAGGARVALLTMPYIDPPQVQADGEPFAENEPGRVDAYNRLLETVARTNPAVAQVVDVNSMLDPAGHYTSVVDGVVTRTSDREHITIGGGELIRPELLPILAQLGYERTRPT